MHKKKNFNICLNIFLGSFPNSRRQIEPELLRILMQNWRLDDLLSAQPENMRLIEGLKLIRQRATTGSLASYDEYEFSELVRFRHIYNLKIEDTITGAEFLPGEMMPPKKVNVSLPDDIYTLLVEYYNEAYDSDFFRIGEGGQSDNEIIVRPKINQFGRIRIGAELFGSANTPRYLRSSYILAKFIQENEENEDSMEIFPGQVQFFFEHEVNLPNGRKTHLLAYVRWFLPAPNHQTRFYCRIDDDIKSCNVEIWSTNFYDISRDCIIPVHDIFGRFIPASFKIGKRNPITYMAVIPIGRRFHM
jgi:hypothetical protein